MIRGMASPRTILLIDEETAHRGVVENALRKAGYRVIAVADTEAALGWLDAAHALPSLIVFAWTMPAAKSLELFGALSGDTRRAAIPVVVMSDVADASRVPARAAAVMGKPARLRTLLYVIARLSGADVRPTPIIRRGRGRPTAVIRKLWGSAPSVGEADTVRDMTPIRPERRAS
jgi:DNA-binding NtrC family response regulator